MCVLCVAFFPALYLPTAPPTSFSPLASFQFGELVYNNNNSYSNNNNSNGSFLGGTGAQFHCVNACERYSRVRYGANTAIRKRTKNANCVCE